METLQLKEDFHKLIDDFSDIKMLEQLYELLRDYENREEGVDFLSDLTKDQELRLKASIKQAKDGDTVSHEEVARRVKDWLTR